MFFNPLFMQSVSEAGAQTVSKNNKLSNSKYLFSDIIKVFNESDPTLPAVVSPESTSVSAIADIFSFQTTDISNGSNSLNFQKPNIAEDNANQNIFELINKLLLTNGSQVKQSQGGNGLLDQAKENSGLETTSQPDGKEFVVQSENLLEILAQLFSANTAADFSSKTISTTGNVLLGENKNAEVLLSNAIKELEEKGVTTIELKNNGKSFQFTISKVDGINKGDDGAAGTTTAGVQSNDQLLNTVVPTENNIKENESTQPQSKETAPETSNVISEIVGTTKSENLKNKFPLTSVVEKPEEKSSSKVTSGTAENGVNKTAETISENNPAISEYVSGNSKGELQTNKVEVKSDKPELQSSKVETKSVKIELQPNEAELKINKAEVQSDKSELQSSEAETKSIKIELQPNKVELPTNKPELQTEKVGLQSNKIEPQISKVISGQLNENSDAVIRALEIEPAKNGLPKSNIEYKIVVQVQENLPENTEVNKETPGVKFQKTETQSASPKSVSSDGEVQSGIKNLINTQTTNNVKQNLNSDFVQLSFENELPFSPKFSIAGNKVIVSAEQSKIDPSDINLLTALAHTKDKLDAVSKPESSNKTEANTAGKISISAVKQPIEQIKTASPLPQENSFEENIQSKNPERIINNNPGSLRNEKEVAIQKSDIIIQNKNNSESAQTEPQAASRFTLIQKGQSENISNAAPIVNEQLQMKNKQENDDKKVSSEIQKALAQKEAEKTAVKSILSENESRLPSGDVPEHQTSGNDLNFTKETKPSETKPLPGSEETKPAEIQNAASSNHQTSEVKISSAKEKILPESFQLPETEKTIKSFELTKEISKLFESGTSQKVVLKLLPEALGKVKLTLEVGGEIIHAKAEVETESVKQMLQTNTETLKQTLSQNGLQLASFNVSLSGSDEKQSKAYGQKKRANNFGDKVKIDKQILPVAIRKLGYNTYEYLA